MAISTSRLPIGKAAVVRCGMWIWLSCIGKGGKLGADGWIRFMVRDNLN